MKKKKTKSKPYRKNLIVDLIEAFRIPKIEEKGNRQTDLFGQILKQIPHVACHMQNVKTIFD